MSMGYIVPHLWLCLFSYDLANYLAPGWLTYGSSRPMVNGRKLGAINVPDMKQFCIIPVFFSFTLGFCEC